MEPTHVQTIFPPDLEVSKEIRELSRFKLSAPSEEDLANDPKLAYLWEKYGKIPGDAI